jgi:nucleotide-binding universal stress UspA family protein
MKTILVHIRDDDGQAARLQAALDLTRAFDGHLVCLQATPFDAYIIGDPFGGVYAFPEIVARVREDEEAERSRIEADLANEGVAWEWLHYDGAAAQMLVEQGRLADCIVLSRPEPGRGARRPLPIAADVTLHARTPVLAVPEAPLGVDVGAPVLVAWNGSAEAAAAVRAALPYLSRASAVHVATVGAEGADLPSTAACRFLSRHGIASELHAVDPDGRSIADALLATAQGVGAGALVMGAYGRSRLRELVLGGVTDDLLNGAPLPLLLAH